MTGGKCTVAFLFANIRAAWAGVRVLPVGHCRLVRGRVVAEAPVVRYRLFRDGVL